MAINSYKEYSEAIADGVYWESWFHKTSAPTPGAASRWGDLSVGAGTPKYNAYVGNQYEFTPLVNTNNSAIYCGPTPADGQTKYLTDIGIQSLRATSNIPLTFVLCDYLGFYPLVDGDSLDLQVFDNTSPLPRYANGQGVLALLVVAAPLSAAGTITMNYVNCELQSKSVTFGVSALSTLGVVINTAGNTTASGAMSLFAPLSSGCKGIHHIESVTCNTAVGGLFNIILVKPLAQTIVREANTWTEKSTFFSGASLPRVYDGAFLNFFFLTSGTGNPATVRGKLGFTWG